MKNLKMFAIGLVAFAAMTMGVHAAADLGTAKYEDEDKVTVRGNSNEFATILQGASDYSKAHDNMVVTVTIEDGDISDAASSLSGDIKIEGNVILDLADHKVALTNTSYRILVTGSLTVKGNGGTLTNAAGATKSLIKVQGENAKLTIEKGVTIDNISTNVAANAIILFGDPNKGNAAKGATITINGTVKSAAGNAVATRGDLAKATVKTAPVVNINDGAVIESKGTGYYQAGYAIATIGKATISGLTGVGVKAGNVTFNGSTITGNGDAKPCENNESNTGITDTGAAVQVEGNATYDSPAKVTFNGGSYTSENNSAVMACSYGDVQALAKDSKINDGEFTSGTDENNEDLPNVLLYFQNDGHAVDYINDLTGFIVKGTFNGPIAGTATVGTNSMAAATLLAKLTNGATVNTDDEGNSTVNGSTAGQKPSDEQKPNTGDGANTPGDNKNPQTGDSIMTYMGLGIASIAVVGLGAKNLRKQTSR